MWALVVCGVGTVLLAIRWQYSDLTCFEFLEREAVGAFARLWHRCAAAGRDPVPVTGPAILIANHPSPADPAFLIATCKRPPHFLQAQEFYQVFLLRSLFKKCGCISVGRNGREVTGVRLALRQLQEGALLGIFPEGDITAACRRRKMEAKGGAALLALRSRAPVFPACIIGGPQGRSVLRAWLWPSPGVRVVYGPPIDLSPYFGKPLSRQVLREVTALFLKQIDRLAASASGVASAPRGARGEALDPRYRGADATPLAANAAVHDEGFVPRPKYPRPPHGRGRRAVTIGGRA